MIRTFSPVSTPPMSLVNEVPLKLTRKCMDVMGSTVFDFTYEKRTIGKEKRHCQGYVILSVSFNGSQVSLRGEKNDLKQ